MGRAVLLCAALLIVLPQLASAVCTKSYARHATKYEPNSLATYKTPVAGDGTTTLAVTAIDAPLLYCQFADLGDGNVDISLADSTRCLPLCAEGYMADSYLVCGSAAITNTPTCLPATKVTSKLRYDFDGTTGGTGLGFVPATAGITTVALYNAVGDGTNDEAVNVRAFFECAFINNLLMAGSDADNSEIGKLSAAAGCVTGTNPAAAIGAVLPWASQVSQIVSSQDPVPIATVKSVASATRRDADDQYYITFTAWVISTEAAALSRSAATTISQAQLKTNAEVLADSDGTKWGVLATAMGACGAFLGAATADGCGGGTGTTGPFELHAADKFCKSASTCYGKANFLQVTTDINVYNFCPASTISSRNQPTPAHMNLANSCAKGIPGSGKCLPVCASGYMPSEYYHCSGTTTSGGAATLNTIRPTCMAVSEIQFTVDYEDGTDNKAMGDDVATYNAGLPLSTKGWAAQFMFNCAVLEVIMGGDGTKAGKSDGTASGCTVYNMARYDAPSVGSSSIMVPTKQLLAASSGTAVPYISISSAAVASTDVATKKGFDIKFTVKWVPTSVSATATVTEAVMNTNVLTLAASAGQTKLGAGTAALITLGTHAYTTWNPIWTTWTSAVLGGSSPVSVGFAYYVADKGLFKSDPVAADVAAVDFDGTTTTTISVQQLKVCAGSSAVTNGDVNTCGSAMPQGGTCNYTCSSGYTSGSHGSIFDCTSVGTGVAGTGTPVLSPAVGNMTCTAVVAATATAASASGGNSTTPTGTFSTVASTITFSGYTYAVSAATTNFGNLVSCAFARCISDSASTMTSHMCTATAGPTFTYVSGASSTNTVAAVARRAGSTVATSLKIYETTLSKSLAESAGVTAFSTMATLNAQIGLMNTAAGTGFSAADMTAASMTPPAWTTSSAAVVLPSMMAMFSAVLLVLMQ